MPLRSLADVDWARWRPRHPATLVFVVREDRILLIRKKRGLGAGKVNGPGGKCEPGESAEACARRELHEELRVDAPALEWMGENRFQFVDGYAIHVQVYRTGTIEGTPEETDEARPFWVPVDAIPYDEMWEDDRLWVPLLLEGKRFSGRYLFDGDAMLDHALEPLG